MIDWGEDANNSLRIRFWGEFCDKSINCYWISESCRLCSINLIRIRIIHLFLDKGKNLMKFSALFRYLLLVGWPLSFELVHTEKEDFWLIIEIIYKLNSLGN